MTAAHTSIDLLLDRFAGWDADRILRHFQTRAEVRYFAVIADPEEARRERVDAIVGNKFEFNGETHVLPEGFSWAQNPSADLEWLILLHKFYYAAGLGDAYRQTGDSTYLHKWMKLTDSWIESVPVGFLSSDVTGRRIQNWIHAHYYFVTACPNAPVDPGFYSRFLRSLHAQTAWLRRNVTPARNHRTLELTAIFMAAVVFPEFREAAEWLQFAIGGLVENMRSDLLPDGVQCELSTDYHHIVLRNYLVVRRLAALNDIPLPYEVDDLIRRALDFAMWVHRPDGTIPALSDGDTGSFLDLLAEGAEIFDDSRLRYVATGGRDGRAPRERLRGFEASGYYFLRSGWGEGGDRYPSERYLVFDCGPLGAGNHGHLDLLHFEAYAYGRPLVVDAGRYTYHEAEAASWRAAFRGTRYHNTATVDGRNQTRYGFERNRFRILGPEPVRELDSFTSDGDIDSIKARCRSHEYDAVHERRIIFVRGEYWVVSDFLWADSAHDYDVWFHLTPEAQDALTLHPYSAAAPGIVLAHERRSSVNLSIEPGFVSPKYGFKFPAPIVRLHAHGTHAAFHTALVPYNDAPPRVRVDCRNGRRLLITIHTPAQTLFDSIDFDAWGRPSFQRESGSGESTSATPVAAAR